MTKIFISFKSYCGPEFQFEKIFYLWPFPVKLWGLKIAILANLGLLTRDIFRAINA